MKNLIIITLSLILTSCFEFKDNKEYRLNLNESEIQKMTYKCGEQIIPLDSEKITYLTEKINSSKHIGPVKGIVRQNLTIYLKNSDTINVRLIGNKFKWDKSGDWAYELDIDDNYFDELCQKELSKSLKIEKPVKTIERIFNQYNEFQESTDSQDNLDSLKHSLKKLENTEVSDSDLTLIVNVWMYYTVTDFSTMEYTENVLFSHRKQSVSVVENRIRNKMEWETEASAPYSDLKYLLEKLKDK
ncbi:hypothetical protein V2611_14525 [Tenacibaculum maritimum]|uniref:hypothetical protein n=1 Tax=Tenacibaculum maritimum TaxID=107401 RepID=UPI003875E8A8